MAEAHSTLQAMLTTTVARWAQDNELGLTAGEIGQAADRAARAIVSGAPNAATAITPEAAFWQTATGPSGS